MPASSKGHEREILFRATFGLNDQQRLGPPLINYGAAAIDQFRGYKGILGEKVIQAERKSFFCRGWGVLGSKQPLQIINNSKAHA